VFSENIDSYWILILIFLLTSYLPADINDNIIEGLAV
jgi:hypothetical protein